MPLLSNALGISDAEVRKKNFQFVMEGFKKHVLFVKSWFINLYTKQLFLDFTPKIKFVFSHL